MMGIAQMPADSCAHVYVHVPFCARRCSYCDFAIAVRKSIPVVDYVRGVAREIEARALGQASPQGQAPVQSIYLGGGTPSRLGGDGVRMLLDMLRTHFPPAAGAEITIEVNPEDVTIEATSAWVSAGVSRISLGVQSFNDSVLRWMHRVHDAPAVPRAMDLLRSAGLHDISVDLIFAVPSQLDRDWQSDVQQALALAPTHVSLYGLTIEHSTPLGRWTARGETTEAPDTTYESDFLYAHEALTTAGFEHYEVSNYGLPGHHARHNAAYWRGVPYLGLGPSAHGYDGVERRWNVSAYAGWQHEVDQGRDPLSGAEQLTVSNREAEAVYLGLRTSNGLSLRNGEHEMVRPWEEAGWVNVSADGGLRCTPLGWLRLDALAAALTTHRSP